MSLFGNFYERIHGSPEFLASESLNYILNSSKKANENLVKLINHGNGSDYSDISFLSQVHGENNEIPDLFGYDKKGSEVIIIETKFWASLTGNQPGTYIKRLNENGTLIFVCPDLRIHSLKTEIINALKDAEIVYSLNDEKICIDKKSILIYSWDAILNAMEMNIETAEFAVRSDIDQLRGLCNRIDNDSFLPITQKDLSPEIPKRILSYNRIIDKVIDKLELEVGLTHKRLLATGQVWGYTRYAMIDKLTFGLNVDFEHWSQYEDTPIWIEISIDWKQPERLFKINAEIEKKYGKINYASNGDRPYYPIRIKPGDIEGTVVNCIADFIKDIFHFYKTII